MQAAEDDSDESDAKIQRLSNWQSRVSAAQGRRPSFVDIGKSVKQGINAVANLKSSNSKANHNKHLHFSDVKIQIGKGGILKPQDEYVKFAEPLSTVEEAPGAGGAPQSDLNMSRRTRTVCMDASGYCAQSAARRGIVDQ